MREYRISIEISGEQVPVGAITGDTPESACFQYAEAYLTRSGAAPLSISLPLGREPFSPACTRAFFDGLLPEGFTRRSVAQWMHLDEEDYLSILCCLGRECLGAIRVTDGEEEPKAGYERISASQIRELAAEGATKSAELVTKSHLSLTGASGKVGLYYDAAGGEWYLPIGTAPSTHIVKQSHVRLTGIVANEQLSLLTAKKCGIEVPQSFIINTGTGRDEDVLLATGRYDRVMADTKRRISGLPRPMRLHQEDFAQAMGIPASRKYEKQHEGYLKGMFDLLRKYSADPIADLLKLWDIIVYDFLVGNTDAHIKNFSLLYSPDMKRIRFAPAYDLVSTTVYEQSTRDMAFAIGRAYSLDEITEDNFRQAARDAGLGEKMALGRFAQMRERFVPALREAAAELAEAGYSNAEQTAATILKKGGIGKV